MSTSGSESVDEQMTKILETSRVIAVVGWSDREDRPSHGVANYLRKQGHQVIPVNPRLAGQKWSEQVIYSSLAEIPERVDLVDVFRRPEYTPAHAVEAVQIEARYLWLQLGILNDDAMAIAREGGLVAIQDRCTQIEHLRLIRGIVIPTS
ncbi:CoA-binding protein [soil metagenome]